ncbi:STAS domain-containing protein [Geomicrobium sediminis]|uniref:RsbT co-antagonist protein RsbR n=1 Tax=Geomicrobium sediminis TaxID=1347788 RepID=A0ABS2PG94_9BACL|nr:STAS domain-containing protein [Geomicrobium sediminis]MBM7634448.1 rsbT co-antagonist protein RsbR [Geomicrobium sediminis]
MRSIVLQHMIDNKDHYIEQWRVSFDELLFSRSESTIKPQYIQDEMKEEFVSVIFDTLTMDGHSRRAVVKRFAERLIHDGWVVSEFIMSLQKLRRIVMKDLSNHYDREKFVDLSGELEDWLDEQITDLTTEFAKNHEEVKAIQTVALKELSAPLIPVFDKIVVMPLIGTIDTKRASQIMENLLDGIIEHRAQVVLIDITGVPLVDTMVAHHIIRASEAVRLVGAECLLVGIRPEIAQTIVNLGIDLGNFTTKSTLKKGVEAALQMTHRDIITNEEPVTGGGLN